MEARRRLAAAALLGVSLAAGCPRAPEQASSSHAPSPAPVASRPASSPTPEARPPEASSSPPAPEVERALPPEVIALGTQAHPWPGVTLGLERVEPLGRRKGNARREEQAGLLTLGLGQLFFSSDVFPGERVRLGGALLEVLGVEPQSLRFRWLTSPAGVEPPQIRPAKPRMRELGLYRFRDGRVLGVGKVTTLAKRDGAAVAVVSLSVFPPGYAKNPLQDYEVLPRLVVGKPVGGGSLGGRQLHLAELAPAEGDRPGWIRLSE